MGAMISAVVKVVGSACQWLYRVIQNCFSKVWAIVQKLFRRHNTGTSATNDDFMGKFPEDFIKGSIENFMVNSMGGCIQEFPEVFMEKFLEKFTEKLMSKCMEECIEEFMSKCMEECIEEFMSMSMEEFMPMSMEVFLDKKLMKPTSKKTQNKLKFKVVDKETKHCIKSRKKISKRNKNKE